MIFTDYTHKKLHKSKQTFNQYKYSHNKETKKNHKGSKQIDLHHISVT